MITGNMGMLEVWQVFHRNEKNIESFSFPKARRLMRDLRKGLGKMVWRCYDYVSPDKTEFKLVLWADRKMCRYTAFAYCRETNLYIRCPTFERTVKDYVLNGGRVYTPHFLHRYAERILGDPGLKDSTILAKLVTTTNHLMMIYREGHYCVYVGKDGLYFSSYDQSKGFFVLKTVVSSGMLKSSQISVYRQMHGLMSDTKEVERIFQAAEEKGPVVFLEEFARHGIDYGALCLEYRSYFEKQGRVKPMANKGTLEWTDALKLAGKGTANLCE